MVSMGSGIQLTTSNRTKNTPNSPTRLTLQRSRWLFQLTVMEFACQNESNHRTRFVSSPKQTNEQTERVFNIITSTLKTFKNALLFYQPRLFLCMGSIVINFHRSFAFFGKLYFRLTCQVLEHPHIPSILDLRKLGGFPEYIKAKILSLCSNSQIKDFTRGFLP